MRDSVVEALGIVAIVILLFVLLTPGQRTPSACVKQGGHIERYECHTEWTIDLQLQADGSISDFSRYDTQCRERCVVDSPR